MCESVYMSHKEELENCNHKVPRKKLLFILDQMYCGGPQRSLLNLLYVLEKERFYIELLLFRKGGALYSEIPSHVQVSFAKPHGLYCRLEDSKIDYLIFFPLRALIKLFISIIPLGMRKKQDLYWRLYSLFSRRNKEEYNMAIAYIEGCIRYLTTKISAKIKIGRIPTDYKSAKFDEKIDIKYFKQLDFLFVVSEKNKDILKEVFPGLIDKIIVFPSIISPDIVREKSFQGDGFKDNFDGTRILTLARLHLSKGIDLAIEACSILVNQGLNIRWYYLGSGDKIEFTKKIIELKLINYFFILDETSNPYTFLRQADIYVQPSRYEGKSNAVNEAKALYKKIVITKFPSASEHLIHMKEGLVSEIDSESIALSIKRLINSPELGNSFTFYLRNNFKSNEREIDKLYKLMDNSDLEYIDLKSTSDLI